MPQEYIDFRLIKDLYHCLPSQLQEEDGALIEMHLAFMHIEQEEEHKAAKRAEQKSKKY